MSLRNATAVAILVLAGCSRPAPAPTPELALGSFLAAAAKADEPAARRQLTTRSLELIGKLEHTAREMKATNVPEHILPAFLARFRDEAPAVEKSDVAGERAVLSVRYRSGHAARLRFAREDGAWKLDLGEDLEPSLTLLEGARARLDALARGEVVHSDDDD